MGLKWIPIKNVRTCEIEFVARVGEMEATIERAVGGWYVQCVALGLGAPIKGGPELTDDIIEQAESLLAAELGSFIYRFERRVASCREALALIVKE